MAKKIQLTSLFVLLTLFSIAFASNPANVKTFETTGQCPKCDLSDVWGLITKYSGAMNLEGADFAKTYINMPINKQHQHSNFSGIFAPQFNYASADLSYSSFTGADLQEASLQDDNFTSANFTDANVSGVNFTNSDLYKAILSATQLKTVGSVCNAILPNGSIGRCS